MTIGCSACEARVRSCIAVLQAGDVGLGGERLDVRAVHDELAHVVHELVEALGVDADASGVLRATGRRGRGGGAASATGAAAAAAAAPGAAASTASGGR